MPGDIIRSEVELKSVPLQETQESGLVSKVLLEVDRLNKTARLELGKAREIFDRTSVPSVLKKICPTYKGTVGIGVIKYNYLAGGQEKRQQSVAFSGTNFEKGGWIYNPGEDKPSLEELSRTFSHLASIDPHNPEKFSVSFCQASVSIDERNFREIDKINLKGIACILTTTTTVRFRLHDPLREQRRLELYVSSEKTVNFGIIGKKETPREPISMVIDRSIWNDENLLYLITSQVLEGVDQPVTLPIQ